MSDWRELPDEESGELGLPIAELRGLGEEAPPGFLARFRRRINRKRLAGDVVDFGVLAFFHTFFAFLKALLESFGALKRTQEED
jgi:hypothetical protein